MLSIVLNCRVPKKIDDGNVHFLDIKINKTETDIYYKPTFTGQYAHFESQTPWRFRINWINALFNRATKICSTKAILDRQILKIKSFISWNGYPAFV